MGNEMSIAANSAASRKPQLQGWLQVQAGFEKNGINTSGLGIGGELTFPKGTYISADASAGAAYTGQVEAGQGIKLDNVWEGMGLNLYGGAKVTQSSYRNANVQFNSTTETTYTDSSGNEFIMESNPSADWSYATRNVRIYTGAAFTKALGKRGKVSVGIETGVNSQPTRLFKTEGQSNYQTEAPDGNMTDLQHKYTLSKKMGGMSPYVAATFGAEYRVANLKKSGSKSQIHVDAFFRGDTSNGVEGGFRLNLGK